MKLLIALSSLFISILFLFIGNGLYLSYAGIQMSQMGLTQIQIGMVNSCFFLGAVFMGIAGHRIISRVGHIRAFSVFTALITVATLSHALSDDGWAWALLRFIQGFSYYGLLTIVESWLNEKSDSSIRSRILAFYEITFFSAFSIGILIMGLGMDNNVFFIVCAIIMVIAIIPVSLARIETPSIPKPQRISIPRLFDITPLAIIGSYIGGVLINGFFTMSSVYALTAGLSIKQVSYFMTAAMIGGFMVQYPIGKLSDTYGRRLAITISSGIAFFAALGISFSYSSVTMQYIFAFFFGCGAFTLYSLSLARANDVLNTIDNQLSSIEIGRSLLFCYSMGALTAPILLGYSMEYFGLYGFGGLFAIACLILFIFPWTQRHISKKDRGAYIPMSATSKTAIMTELDPRFTDEIENTPHTTEQLEKNHTEHKETNTIDNHPENTNEIASIMDDTKPEVIVSINDTETPSSHNNDNHLSH